MRPGPPPPELPTGTHDGVTDPPTLRDRPSGALTTPVPARAEHAPTEPGAPSASDIRIAGDRGYELGPEIARGAMGRVVRGRDRHLQREVALKLSTLSRGHDARFEREVVLTARLQHPNIIPIYDAGELDGTPFYAMRPIAGLRLDERVALATTREQRLELLPHVIAVGDAIAYAHRQRVIHRDLKPHNILVGEFGETVVIDWGLGKLVDEGDSIIAPSPPGAPTETIAGSVIGTTGYMPPEQARGEPADYRSDVYSLGCLLFHTLTGEVPQPGMPELVVARLVEGDTLDVARATDLPPELRAIIEKATRLDRARRYQDAGELMADLRRYQAGLLVEAHRYRWHQRLGRALRRHRLAATVIASVAVTAAVVGWIAIRGIVEERDRADAERAAATDLLGYLVDDLPGRLRATGQLDVVRDAAERLDAYYARVRPTRVESTEDIVRLAEIRSIRGEIAAHVGMRDAGVALSAAALELAQDARRRGAPNAAALVARLLIERGSTLQGDQTAEAAAAYKEGIALLDQLPPSPDHRGLRARAEARLATLALRESRFEDAAALLADARRALADSGAHDLLYELTLSAIEHVDGQRIYVTRAPGARPRAEAAVAAARRAVKLSPLRPDARVELAGAQGLLGAIARDEGDLDAAVAALTEEIATQRTLLELDPANIDWQANLANALATLARVRDERPGTPAASELRTQAGQLLDDIIARDPRNISNRQLHIDILRDVGSAEALDKAEQIARGLPADLGACARIDLARDRAVQAVDARDRAGARARLDDAAKVLAELTGPLPRCARFSAFEIAVDRASAAAPAQRRPLLDAARAVAEQLRAGGLDEPTAAELRRRIDRAAAAP